MSTLSAESLQCIIRMNPKLTYLCLERSYNAVNDETLHTIGRTCKLLRTACFSHCMKIGDAGLYELVNGCNKLTELSLAHCYEISSTAMCRLANLSRLEVLSLECNLFKYY